MTYTLCEYEYVSLPVRYAYFVTTAWDIDSNENFHKATHHEVSLRAQPHSRRRRSRLFLCTSFGWSCTVIAGLCLSLLILFQVGNVTFVLWLSSFLGLT